ncbi:hypothetical protein AWB64_03851 [Caballeronia sordidicola]|uniref:Uncharacterized protein n=1 Tax=Caballeronia sordidicola TaxID=196367 RepID=A0A158H073_CABSO|nr:hypothetical protein AWB64_03851 [Caballeronia sordidicola]
MYFGTLREAGTSSRQTYGEPLLPECWKLALRCRDLIVCKRRTRAKRLRKILGLTFEGRESGSAGAGKRRNYLKFVPQRTQEFKLRSEKRYSAMYTCVFAAASVSAMSGGVGASVKSASIWFRWPSRTSAGRPNLE